VSREVTETVRLTMTDEELERALIERIARLGLTDVGETQH
jgi:hypothetical protein